MKRLIMIGAGGFAAEVLWVANEMKKWDCVGFADDDIAKQGGTVEGLPIIGTIDRAVEDLSSGPVWFHCAIGDNARRKAAFKKAMDRHWIPATLVHPSVIIAPGVQIGAGTYIAAACVLSTGVRTGEAVLLNMNVSVGHDSVLEDFSQASPGSRINGHCTLGELSFLGSNASLLPGIKVGAKAKVASNSFAINNIPEGTSVIGIPAKQLSGSSDYVAAGEPSRRTSRR
jgi:sugar O-acyltransferase (sialic acid O-acetyltransferase NeuD family)